MFKHDKTEYGCKLLEDVPFDGKRFGIQIVEFLDNSWSCVNGGEMKQIAIKLKAHLGQYHAEYLLEHQELIPKNWQGKYLVFPGTVWLDRRGYHDVPYLGCGDNNKWYLGFRSLEGDWGYNDRLVFPCQL